MKFVKSHYIHSNLLFPFILQELKMELFVMGNLRIWSILSILTLCSFRLTQQQPNSRKSKFLKVFRLPLLHKIVVWIIISFQTFCLQRFNFCLTSVYLTGSSLYIHPLLMTHHFLANWPWKKLGTSFAMPVQWLLRAVVKKGENLSLETPDQF